GRCAVPLVSGRRECLGDRRQRIDRSRRPANGGPAGASRPWKCPGGSHGIGSAVANVHSRCVCGDGGGVQCAADYCGARQLGGVLLRVDIDRTSCDQAMNALRTSPRRRWMAAVLTLLLAGAAVAPRSVRAQTGSPAAAEPGAPVERQLGPADIIMPHITDSKTIEYPCYRGAGEWACEATFPTWNVTVAGHTYDLGITKHIFFMMLAALIVAIVLIATARSHVRATRDAGRPKGFAAGLEAVVLYFRNEIFLPALGHGGAKFVPFCLTLFFFILFCNLFGLIPYGSTPTGNVAVTATLAAITFVMIEIAGMRALGKGYLGTIIYWPKEGQPAMKLMTIIMTPVEIVGKFTKPFALTIRLFANMIAGHVIILALIGLIFMFGLKIFLAPLAMALFIMFLEILVAFIQAFIFSLLAAVFIGQIRAAHH